MGFLSRLVSKINGTIPNQNQSKSDTQTKETIGSNPLEVSENKNIEHNVSQNFITEGQQKDAAAENSIKKCSQSDNEISSKIESTNETSTQEDEPKGSAEGKPEIMMSSIEEKNLYSNSLSEQRYAWHKYLSSILSSIETDKVGNLKHFSIFIRKIPGCKYQWNDEAFKKELLYALEPYDCASHIGSATFNIEIVLDKIFQQVAAKTINEIQFKQEFKDIILFGSKKETTEQKFATAIDKRAFVINELLKKFRSSTGTDTKLMENLTIIVIRNEDDDDMAEYDWIGKRFEDDLRRELTNAFLEKIGSKSLQIALRPKSGTEGCICLIDNQVYYKWSKTDTLENDSPKVTSNARLVATLSIIEGTGSLMKPSYTLDSDQKKTYHIGRGVASRKNGIYRINDIVIKDKEADLELLKCNGHVSGTHADIVFKNNKFYIKAAIGGCRATGGSPTKIIRNEKETELRDTSLLYPLSDGDIIELGKNVLLVYTLTESNSLPSNPKKENLNNAMSIDDSF